MNADERFGHSLALDDGDIVVESGALRLIHGKRNLLQALELRILTPFGNDIFNVNYGLEIEEAFTRSLGIRTVKELIKLNLVRTLATDPRVREVHEVLFEDDPRYLARHPELSPENVRDDRHRRFWQVDVVLDTLSGQTETLAVSVGV